jgi:hypothetical protein
MRCHLRITFALLLGLGSFAAPAMAGDSPFMRALGIGWGPGYHAYNNCGPCQGWSGYGSGYGSGFHGVNPNGYALDFRPPPSQGEPLPATRAAEPGPPAQPEPTPARSAAPFRPPMYGPSLAPPLVKPSEQAARAGRYFPPSPEYSPTYVGQQRYPGARY